MLSQLIELSLKNRFLVLSGTLLMAAAGLNAALHLPIDAVPDMTNVQVTVITNAGSLSPVEVERYITYPVETTMGGLPRVEEVRSVSKFGISVVTIVFDERANIYQARQLVAERLPAAISLIPNGYGTPELGPLTTALGEILQFEVRGESKTPMELRTILEWDVVPKLREVRGVTEVNTHGGFYRTFEIRPDPDRLSSLGLTLDDLSFVETHDCFTIAELIEYEAMGLTPEGEGARAIKEGWTQKDGKLPVNPSGGLKAKGHPIGATGVSMHVLTAMQLTGTAGDLQVQNARLGGIFNMGGTAVANYVSILERLR